MPYQHPRLPPVMASILAATGIVLAVASCTGHMTPLGPGQAATMPQPHQLRSPLILQDMRTQGLAGRVGQPVGCPAGWVKLSAGPGPGQCYRKLGTPVTITSAAVTSPLPAPPPGQPVPYGLVITVPAADLAALTAVTTTAADAHGYLSISVADRIWLLPRVLRPFTSPHFEIAFPSRNQARQLQRMLVPAG